MLKEIQHSIIYYSKLGFTPEAFLYETSFYFEPEVTKKKNDLHVKLTCTYIASHLETKQKVEILKAQSTFVLVTDGKIKDFEAYQPFKYIMQALIIELHRQERNNGMSESKGVRILTLREIQSDADRLVSILHLGHP